MDMVTDASRVDARRVNDPSRTTPADVNVRNVDEYAWERAFEVRDKPVTREDLLLLVGECAVSSVGDAIMVAIAPSPPIELLDQAQAWAAERGVALTVFSDWSALITQALFWASTPTPTAAAQVPARIEQRLIEAEASAEALQLWAELFTIVEVAPEQP